MFGVCSLAFGVMLGAIPTSVPQFILLGNWLLEGQFKAKWRQLRHNKIFWALSSIFLIHLAGMLYSSNFDAGLDDLRIKMPMVLLALVFFSSAPLSEKEFHLTLGCFLLGSVCNTLWCVLYSFVLHHNEVGRDASRFMSHIRLGLYLNMAVVCSIYFFARASQNLHKAGFMLLGAYFVAMMFLLGLASGLTGFLILAFFGACFIVYSQKMIVKVATLLGLLAICGITIGYVRKVKSEQLTLNTVRNNTLLKFTESGHGYIYLDTLSQQKENGNYVMINIQLEELKQEWQRQFPKDSFSYNPTPHNLKRFDVLLHYLSSKGLNKDSAGISKLTAEDKANIQKDIGNYRYPHWNYLHKRVYELVNEYDEFEHDRNINGHSLTMRFYFWKAALHIIKHNLLFGVGTGDVQRQMDRAYTDTNSPLWPEWYKRPHNQFLTITVALGLVGLLVLLFSLIYPVSVLRHYLPFLYWPFLILLITSFLVEDTLESQAGLSFYVFFNTLFLSVAWFREHKIKDT